MSVSDSEITLLESKLSDLTKQIRTSQNRIIDAENILSKLSETNSALTATDLDTLKSLNDAFQTLESSLNNKQIQEIPDQINVARKWVGKLVERDPHTLLEIDCNLTLSNAESTFQSLLSSQFNLIVKLTKDSLLLVLPQADSKASEIDGLHTFVLQTSPQTANFISEFRKVIDDILDLKIKKIEFLNANEIHFKPGRPDFNELVEVITVLVGFISKSHDIIKSGIPRRYSTYFIRKFVNETVLEFLPLNKQQFKEFENEFKIVGKLEGIMREAQWTKTGELIDVSNNLSDKWIEFKRHKCCSNLRDMYISTDLNSETGRFELIREVTLRNLDKREEQEHKEEDDWDWNDDEEEEEPEEHEEHEEPEINANETNEIDEGKVVDLFKTYINEIGVQQNDPLFKLYEAITPIVYKSSTLWLYADTRRLNQHLQLNSITNAIPDFTVFLDKLLREYLKTVLEEFKYEILPNTFGQLDLVSNVKLKVTTIAEQTNEVGGADLRVFIVSQVLEQIAVYIISRIIQMSQIANDESEVLSAYIAHLDSLLVFVPDIEGVPSWNKLSVLSRILTGNLSSINDMLEKNLLVDFTADELSHLIKALFVDSELRYKLIKNIYSVI